MEIWLKSLSDRMDIGLCCRCRYESADVLANLSGLQWIYVVIFAGNRSIRMNRTSCVARRSCLSLFSSQSSSSSSPSSSSSSLLLLLFIHLSSRTERFLKLLFFICISLIPRVCCPNVAQGKCESFAKRISFKWTWVFQQSYSTIRDLSTESLTKT